MARTTLKSKKTNEKLYPQTEAEIVITKDGGNVEQKLRNIETKLSNVEQASDYKGYFPNETALLNKWNNSTEQNPLTHEQSLERAGWYARVGAEGSADTTMYYWDVEDKAWIKGAIVNINGVASVNNLQPDENTGNLTLTAENIPTSFTEEDGTQKSAQDVFYMLQGEHTELENEIEVLQNKTSVIYLTNAQMADAINRLVEPYENGQVVVANDDGNYKLGSSYKFIISGTVEEPVYSWEEITASGGGTTITDTLTLSKQVPEEIITADITYENLTTDCFFEQTDDGWWVNNIKDTPNKYAIMKISINLSKSTNLKFEMISDSSGTAAQYLFFSNIDNEFPLNSYEPSTNLVHFKNSTSAGGNIEYLPFPSGQHFIYVKYMRNWQSGTYTNKFRLVTEFPEIVPEYTSSCTLEVDDNDNLLLNNQDVVTKKGISFIPVIGTSEAPICIYELPRGSYSLSGYFKYVFGTNTYCVVDERTGVQTEDTIKFDIYDYSSTQRTMKLYGALPACYSSSGSVRASIPFKTNGDTYGNLYNCTMTNGSSCEITLRPASSSLDTARMFRPLIVYGGSYTLETYALSTKNETEYTPTENYHPSTKKFTEDTVKASKPILEFENPLNNATEENIRKFASYADTQNKELYFYKTTDYENEVQQVKFNTKYNNPIYLSKTVKDFGSGMTGFMGLDVYYTYTNGTNTYETNTRVYINTINGINLANDNGSNPSRQYNIYNRNTDTWAETNPVVDGYIDLSRFIFDNSAIFGLSSTWQITSINGITFRTSSNLNYFGELVKIPVVTPTRLALYEDVGDQVIYNLSGTTLTITPK